MISKNDIAICIPVYNEGNVIFQVIKDIQKRGYQQIYIIDDGSTDQSRREARKAGAIIVKHVINRGAGAAVQTAIEFVRKQHVKYLLMMDGDGQHCPDDIALLIAKLENTQSDVIVGSRFIDDFSNMPRIRVGYNKIANGITNFFCKNNYSDTQSGLRLLNRKAIEQLNLSLDGFSFCSEMLIVSDRIGLKVEEVAVKTIYSEYSLQKGQNFLGGVTTALDLLRRIIFR